MRDFVLVTFTIIMLVLCAQKVQADQICHTICIDGICNTVCFDE